MSSILLGGNVRVAPVDYRVAKEESYYVRLLGGAQYPRCTQSARWVLVIVCMEFLSDIRTFPVF